jgi:hypothetical protein
MATPLYLGAGQQLTNGGGWLARLGSYFGSGTPPYAGDGQPSPAASGGLLGRGASPAYAAAPVVKAPEAVQQAETSAEVDDAAAESGCPIDPEALASGHIAIVIPRERLGPCL